MKLSSGDIESKRVVVVVKRNLFIVKMIKNYRNTKTTKKARLFTLTADSSPAPPQQALSHFTMMYLNDAGNTQIDKCSPVDFEAKINDPVFMKVLERYNQIIIFTNREVGTFSVDKIVTLEEDYNELRDKIKSVDGGLQGETCITVIESELRYVSDITYICRG